MKNCTCKKWGCDSECLCNCHREPQVEGGCKCGSGIEAEWYFDGYGIELFKGCSECEVEQLAKFRPDILERYECDEPIEPEDYY